MTPAAIERMIERCGRLMILADTYDRRLHWWYRVQHYVGRRPKGARR
jgi:hypothetical protein